MRPDIYFIIHDWMINDLKLRSNELIIFAYIYSFDKFKDKPLSVNHISEVLKIPRRTVAECNRRLMEKDLIDGTLLKTNNFTNKWEVRTNQNFRQSYFLA